MYYGLSVYLSIYDFLIQQTFKIILIALIRRII